MDGTYKIVHTFSEAEKLKKNGATTFYATTRGKDIVFLVIYEKKTDS